MVIGTPNHLGGNEELCKGEGSASEKKSKCREMRGTLEDEEEGLGNSNVRRELLEGKKATDGPTA